VPKLTEIEFVRYLKPAHQIVVVVVQAQIGIVMEVASKDGFTIWYIVFGVQDVSVPELIYEYRRSGSMWVQNRDDKKLPIELFGIHCLARAPSLAAVLTPNLQLASDAGEVQRHYGTDFPIRFGIGLFGGD